MFTRGKREGHQVIEKPIEKFEDFHFYEYNLFWIFHFLIVLCTISYLRANLSDCLEKFFQIINPMTWL